MKLFNNIFSYFFLLALGAFIYSLRRTNGNVYQSIMFSLYFLGIKLGLIEFNASKKLHFYQQNEQILVVKNQYSPGYHPYLSVLDEYRPSRVYMDQIQQVISPNSLYSQSVINRLRAGNSRIRDAALLLVTIWMLQHQSAGFQPVTKVVHPPRNQAIHDLVFGQPKWNTHSSQQSSIFDGEESINEPTRPYSERIMSKEAALDLIIKEYGTLENPDLDYIDERIGLTATRQQLAAKIYHAPSYKVYPPLYGTTKDQMLATDEYGLTRYIENGGVFPSPDLIDAYHQHVKVFYARNKKTINFNACYRGSPAIVVHNSLTGECLIFKHDTKRLWTPTQLKPKQMRRYIETGSLGKQSSLIPEGTTPPPTEK